MPARRSAPAGFPIAPGPRRGRHSPAERSDRTFRPPQARWQSIRPRPRPPPPQQHSLSPSWHISLIFRGNETRVTNVLGGEELPATMLVWVHAQVFPEHFAGLEVDLPDLLPDRDRDERPAGVAQLELPRLGAIEL